MRFISTRGGDAADNAGKAISAGIAGDGGLFVPEKFPQITDGNFKNMLDMNYAERAAFIISKFLDDFDYNNLKAACEKAYSKFEGGDAAPLVKIEDGLYILELFHGPTSAFKDMALTLLPYLLRTGSDQSGVKEKILILVATSGDTGKAALEGFKDADGVKVMVFYPSDGVSKMQKLQMQSQQGENVCVLAVEGNFDDCQSAVKTIFTDDNYQNTFAERGYVLSSANSINFGRLVPQIAYYFSAYCDLVNSGDIQQGDKINFSVPTGNFGNILAAYYAMKMGLPVNKLICASNTNNVLTDFFDSGSYTTQNRQFHKTMSPSMDIMVSSNLERLIFETSGRDSKLTAKRMKELAEKGSYTVSEKEKDKLTQLFYAASCNEDMTVEAVYYFFEDHSYPLDTHTATAVYANGDFKSKTEDLAPTVIVSTASPYKFPQDVLYSITGNDVNNSFKAIKRLYAATAMPIPKNLDNLKGAQIRFDKKADKKDIFDEILKFIDKK